MHYDRTMWRRAREHARMGVLVSIATVVLLALLAAGIALGDDDDGRGVARRAALAAPGPGPAPAPGPAPVQVAVHVAERHPGRPVPSRFLGLSFEASALPGVAAFAGRGNFVGLLRSLGPGVLRFGGVSADTRIAWADARTPRPAWTASALGAGDLRRLGRLAAGSDWRVLLTVGLAHYDPTAAAREVRAAKGALGHWLAGVEIGNEPDAYGHHGLRSLPWRPANYDGEYRAYRRAILRLTSGVRFGGPGVSGSHSFVRWGRALVRAQRPALLTGHHYPLGCHQQPGPSIARLLSAGTRRLAANSLARYMAVSRGSRIPFRMDEANSVSCGGRAGISNTFASALWATDYISQAMAAGVTGINLEGNPANCLGYSPLCATTPAHLARGTLVAQPIWYALLLARALIGDRPLRTASSASQPQNLAVRALRAGDGTLQFVIVSDEPPGAPPAAVSLHVPRRFGPATVLALRAPSPDSTSGVTLGGRAVAGDGSWRGPGALPSVPASGGQVTVTIPPSSAALVSVARADAKAAH
jgi:hypothetical protein